MNVITALFAAASLVEGVLTFDIAPGVTDTYSTPIGSDVTKIVKVGDGTLRLENDNSAFAGKTVEINAGVVEQASEFGLGKNNAVTVANGAQLKFTMDVPAGKEFSCIAGANIVYISGSGPDGNGAIYKYANTTAEAGHSGAFFGNIVLNGDATIKLSDRGGDSRVTGFGRTVQLAGHNLTIIGDNALSLGHGEGRGTTKNIWKSEPAGGSLILDGPAVTFEGSPEFRGDSKSSVVIRKTMRHRFYDWGGVCPWTMKIENYCVLEVSRSYKDNAFSYDVNHWAGPVVIATANVPDICGSSTTAYAGAPGQAITFEGPISGQAFRIYQNQNVQALFKGAISTTLAVKSPLARAEADGVFAGKVDLGGYNTGLAEVHRGDGYCTSAGTVAQLLKADSSSARTSNARMAVYTTGDTSIDAADTITFKDYTIPFSHTGSGELTLNCNVLSKNMGVFFWQKDPVSTVFAGASNEWCIIDHQSGSIKATGDVYCTGGSGGICKVGGNNADGTKLTIGAKFLAKTKPNGDNELAWRTEYGDTGAKPAVVEILPGATVTNLFLAMNGATVKSAYLQKGGDVYSLATRNTRASYVSDEGYGTFTLAGGTYTMGGAAGDAVTRGGHFVGAGRGGFGSFRMTGGKYTANTGSYSLIGTSGGTSEITITGGEMNFLGNGYMCLASTLRYNPAQAGGTAVFTMCGNDPQVNFSDTGSGSDFSNFIMNQRTAGGCNTVLNLNAGLLVTRRLIPFFSEEAKAAGNTAYVNFNGGAMRSTASAANFFGNAGTRPPTAITIFEKGATFDTPEGFKNYMSINEKNADPYMVLKSATGRGVKRITIPEGMPTTGYAGVLPVRVSGGGGTCATAALDFDPATGTIADELIVTCPGWDYTSAPTVTAIGSDYREYACTAELTDGEQDPGVIYKTGAGLLGFGCTTNQFAGTLVISNGTVYVPPVNKLDARMAVKCAGGQFQYGYTSRTVRSIGGWGSLLGSDDGKSDPITVTESLEFDAEDLVAGRKLEVADASGSGEASRDRIVIGDGAVVKLANPSALAGRIGRITLIQGAAPFNRKPELVKSDAELMARWNTHLTDGGKRLELVIPGAGLTIIVR